MKTPIVPLKTHKLDFSIADLTMDPTQDLIVISEYRCVECCNDRTHSPDLLLQIQTTRFLLTGIICSVSPPSSRIPLPRCRCWISRRSHGLQCRRDNYCRSWTTPWSFSFRNTPYTGCCKALELYYQWASREWRSK